MDARTAPSVPPLKRVLLGCAGIIGVSALICAAGTLCLPLGLKHDIWLNSCPAGDLLPNAELYVSGLRRGAPGSVTVRGLAYYTMGPSADHQIANFGRFEPSLSVVDSAGAEVPGVQLGDWERINELRSASLTLPATLPDGDYTVVVTTRSALGEVVTRLPIALYAPAKVHLLTDRPLYEPGNTLLFRAVVLRAADLTPIAGRPGRFVVTDPQGEVVLDERAVADDWGVVSGSFPVDPLAEPGRYEVAWVSGEDEARVDVQVEPFTLPRFRLELNGDRPWYGAGGQPVVRGRVVYSSGAPVARAEVTLEWQPIGDWPPPTAWLEPGGLPTAVVADAEGAFTLTLPAIPADLQGMAGLVANVDATDAAGDRVGGSLSLRFSEDPIQVEALTELPGGLVDGFNNRLFLRATTPVGEPLAGVYLRVYRTWDATDPGTLARTDEDGVAALQIDPGPPGNFVIPAPPWRPAPKPPAVSRGAVTNLRSGEEAGLDDLLTFDRLLASLEPCAVYVDGSQGVTAALWVSPGGGVLRAVADPGPAGDCIAGRLRGARFGPGADRILKAEYTLRDEALGEVSPEIESALDVPEGLSDHLEAASRVARRCLPEDVAAGELGWELTWQTQRGSPAVDLSWMRSAEGGSVAEGVASCVRGTVGPLRMKEPAEADLLGLARFSVAPSSRVTAGRPQDRTELGYALSVAAQGPDGPMGSTEVHLSPGSVPPFRLRASPALAQAGGEVVVELLRGPDFSGELPAALTLRSPRGWFQEQKRGAEARSVTFTLPADASGWYEVSAGGSVARVFVRPENQLQVELSSDAPVYRPGQQAQLAVRTQTGGKGVAAAVTLVGVDESLGQLVTLPGPTATGELLPAATSEGAVFEGIDAVLLSRGGVRGENAAAASVLRILQIPQPAELDRVVSASTSAQFDPIGPLTDRFYLALAELHVGVKAWEAEAPKTEQMKPETMARLWEEALDRIEERGEQPVDAYGQRLRLSQLPADLLSLTDPRMVVIDGTRNPEDVENWAAWVAKEKP